MPASTVERQVAHKVWLASLHSGEYVKQEGWAPNYVKFNGKRVSRTQIVVTVVSKFMAEDGNYGTLTLDDGSDTIRVKAFGPDVKLIEKSKVGAVVRFVGKVKEYNEEVYLSPEIIREVRNLNWLTAHRLELGEMPQRVEQSTQTVAEQKSLGADAVSDAPKGEKLAEVTNKSEESETANKDVMDNKEAKLSDASDAENVSTRILTLISELGKDEGASTSDITAALGVSEALAKEKIAELLASGEIYEPKKGFLKLL